MPIIAGYLTLGSGFGILMVTNGFRFIQALLMSLFIYAGSLQYIAISLFSVNASFISIALTSLLVNSRHLLYGISMFSKYKNTGIQKPYLIFSLTDETYSLVSDKDDKDYFFTVSLLNHIYWILGTILGALIGNIIPFNTEGLEFVLTALFIVIFTEQWLNNKKHFSAISGLLITIICLLIFGKDNFLIPSMIFIIVALMFNKKIEESKKPMNNTYVIIGIGIMSIITIILRSIPFIFLNDKKEYKTLNYLSKVLPGAIMGMLVVYCLKDISFDSIRNFLPAIIASLIVLISYVYKRKTLLSILLGTATYMVLLQFVF